MRYPWANLALLCLLAVLLLTGFWGLTSGAAAAYWVLWLHGMAAYGLVLLLFWKGSIVVHVFRRRPRWNMPRRALVLLSVLLLAILATGLVWTIAGPAYLAGFSLMTIHAVLALGLVGLFAWHVLARRWIFRVPRARDRRAFMRLLGVSLAGVAIWQVSRLAGQRLAWPGSARRFTGSYETGSSTGSFPVVAWLFDNPAPLAVPNWQLTITGAVARPVTLHYQQILGLPQDTRLATIDCTGGWYSEQVWSGVSLPYLLALAGLDPRGRSITVVSSTGYYRRFPLAAAQDYLLATHVAGRPLDHGHGFPVRLVAPDQRGFNWVKWVVQITVDESDALWQPPLPLQ
jgi:DMSO/TMAO reductase YedYZ molybdopterin-dependent catalytic subunit